METISIKLKRCAKCTENKPLDEFGVKKFNKDGLNHYCLLCERKRCQTTYSRPEYKERVKYKQIFRLYGLTKEQYLSKLEQQEYKCAICSMVLSNDKDTHIDHCHSTGKIRDILCKKCNHLLGSVNDDVEQLQKYINYIYVHKSVHGTGSHRINA